MKTLCTWLFVTISTIFAATFPSRGQSSNTCTPPPSGLVSWWQAEGNGIDSAGANTAYAALLPNGVSFAPGQVGQAFNLNGTNAYLFVPSSPSLNVGAGAGLTMEGWIKVSSVSGLHPIAEWYGDVRGQVGVQLWLNSNPFQSGAIFGNFVDTNLNSHTLVSPDGLVQPNVFQHVALTYDQASGTGTLYLNGAVVAQGNLGSFVPKTTYDLWIAHRPMDVPGDWTYGATLGGLLDEFSLYNRALSSNEIAAIYQAGSAGKCSASSGTAPIITHQPTNQVVPAGGTATFSVTATGSAPLYYQWYGPGSALIPGATTSTLTLSNVQPANAGSYFAFVTNAFGFAQSSNAVLTLSGDRTNSGPIITRQPTNQTVAAGGTATFTVTALGASTLYYQWYGPTNNPIPGAITPTLTLSSVQPANAGTYFVRVTNALGFAQSSNAILTVTGGITNDCTPAPNGVVGWWKGDGNTTDSAGTNNGSVTGGPISYASGEVNQAFHYTGDSGYVQIPAAPALNVGLSSGFTIEGWIQPSDIANQMPVFEWQYNTNNNFGGTHFWVSVGSPGCLYANIADTNNNSHLLASPAGILTTNYQHIALTYVKSNGLASIYRNGILVAQTNLGSFTPNTTGNVLLGERTYLFGNPQVHYVGNLDELSLYSRALSQSEIQSIVNAGGAGKCTDSVSAPLITRQPTNQTVAAGSTATFSVTATGTVPLHYQWYGPTNNPIPSAITSTLTLSNVQPANAGTYFVVVTNAYGSARSSNAVLTVTGGITNDCTPVPSGVIGWWKGDGNTSDSAGSNNGSVTGGPISYVAGEVNQAFHYTGDSGYVQIPAAPALNVGLAAGFTIEGWIQPSDLVNQMPVFEWQYNTNNGLTEAHFWVSVGSPGCIYANLIDTNGNAHSLSSAAGILTTNYQHIALTYVRSNGLASIYRNGILVAQTTLGSFIPNTTGNVLLGERTYLGGAPQVHYVGNLDELSLYSRALSQSEIQSIYFTGSGGKCTDSVSAPLITGQPTNQTVAAGGTATFSVTATGTSPLHYQWYGPGSALIPGATASTFTISNAQPSNAGSYFAFVTNAFGFAQSSNAVLTVTGGGGNTNDCTPAPTGLVAWWPGENNAVDVVGGNNGTLVNGVGFGTGEVGRGFLFNQTNQNVLISANSNLDVGQGDGLTLEAWIDPSSITNLYPIFEWNPGDGVTYWGVHMYVFPAGVTNGPTGYLYADVQGIGDVWHQIQTSGDVVTAHSFQHVALTYDKASGIARLYRNGTVVAETAFGTFTPKTTGNLNIGNRPTDPANSSYTFLGVIDEPSVYRRALSSNEIAAIYLAGSNGKCPSAPSGTAPVITKQPTNEVVPPGGTAIFSVTATGTQPLYYQWRKLGAAIPGATNSSLSVPVGPNEFNIPTIYSVVVSNIFGTAVSSNAMIIVGPTNAPLIVTQPANQTVPAGSNATFTVAATGTSPLHYQWYGPTNNPVLGAITSTLTLSNVQPANAGTYFVVVTNAYGSAHSSNAVLTVTGGGGITNDCTPAPSGLVAWWPGESNTVDVVGGNTGTLVNGVGFGTGEVGRGFLFNQTNQNVLISANSNLDVGQGAGLTLEAWINPDAITNRYPIFEWNPGDGVTYWGVHLYVFPTGATNGPTGYLYTDVQGADDSWHTLQSPNDVVTAHALQHVALTYDKASGIARMYRNGSVVAEATFGSYTPKTTGNLNIGSRPNDPGNQSYTFFGVIDEPSIYNRALSSNEIAAIYNASANGKCPQSQTLQHASVSSLPAVNMSVSGDSRVLSWPASAGDYILQSTASLAPINWTNVPLTLETNGDNLQVTLPTGGQQGYFRLYHP